MHIKRALMLNFSDKSFLSLLWGSNIVTPPRFWSLCDGRIHSWSLRLFVLCVVKTFRLKTSILHRILTLFFCPKVNSWKHSLWVTICDPLLPSLMWCSSGCWHVITWQPVILWPSSVIAGSNCSHGLLRRGGNRPAHIIQQTHWPLIAPASCY